MLKIKQFLFLDGLNHTVKCTLCWFKIVIKHNHNLVQLNHVTIFFHGVSCSIQVFEVAKPNNCKFRLVVFIFYAGLDSIFLTMGNTIELEHLMSFLAGTGVCEVVNIA